MVVKCNSQKIGLVPPKEALANSTDGLIVLDYKKQKCSPGLQKVKMQSRTTKSKNVVLDYKKSKNVVLDYKNQKYSPRLQKVKMQSWTTKSKFYVVPDYKFVVLDYKFSPGLQNLVPDYLKSPPPKDPFFRPDTLV